MRSYIVTRHTSCGQSGVKELLIGLVHADSFQSAYQFSCAKFLFDAQKRRYQWIELQNVKTARRGQIAAARRRGEFYANEKVSN